MPVRVSFTICNIGVGILTVITRIYDHLTEDMKILDIEYCALVYHANNHISKPTFCIVQVCGGLMSLKYQINMRKLGLIIL